MEQAQTQPKSGGLVVWLQSIQWMVFLLANVIAVPVVVGVAFDMSALEISDFIQRMLLVTGVATLIQAFIGHRMPLLEGAAGMWWALFLVLAGMAAPGEKGIVLQQLEMGMIVAGAVLVLLALLPIVNRIRELFTPLVTGVYLLLLVMQLSGSFFKGIMGVSMFNHVDGRVVSVAVIEIVLVLVISLKARGVFRSMGPLIGIIVGWVLFALIGLSDTHGSSQNGGAAIFTLPSMLAWGRPVWDFGVVLTCVLTALILISNVVASILVVGRALDQEMDASVYRRGLLGNGISGLLSGTTAVVGLVPLSVSAGFITTTGIRTRAPFVIGAALVAISGLLPVVGHFFALLPSEVAYGALFIPYSQMIGFGVRDLMGLQPTQRNLMVIGMPLMIGAGVMFLPPQSLSTLAPWLRNLMANGLLVGLIICMFLEHVVFRKRESV